MQVQRMVKMILHEEKLPKLDDTTDSMAIAICHAHSAKFSRSLWLYNKFKFLHELFDTKKTTCEAR